MCGRADLPKAHPREADELRAEIGYLEKVQHTKTYGNKEYRKAPRRLRDNRSRVILTREKQVAMVMMRRKIMCKKQMN